MQIYIYIYIYVCVCVCVCVCVFFNPINPAKGTITSEQINYSNFDYLDIPGKALNINEGTDQNLVPFKEQNDDTKN